MEFERAVPGKELLPRQLVDTASLLDRDPAATHGGDHRGFATDDPPFGVRMWQLLDKLRPAHRFAGEGFSWGAPEHRCGRPRTSRTRPKPNRLERQLHARGLLVLRPRVLTSGQSR